MDFLTKGKEVGSPYDPTNFYSQHINVNLLQKKHFFANLFLQDSFFPNKVIFKKNYIIQLKKGKIMVECIDQNWSFIVENWNVFFSILSFLLGGASGFTIHMIIKKDKSTVENKDIIAGRDFVGRDRH